MTAWSIERMTPSGWERVRAIRLRALRGAPDAFGTTYAEDEARPPASWRERLASPDAATFVATADGRDVGLVVGTPYEGRAGCAGLFAMWVDPDRRGHGVGDGLVRAVVEWATRSGFDRVLLDVGDHNAPAIALYERNGFVPTGRTGVVSEDRPHVREHERERRLRSPR